MILSKRRLLAGAASMAASTGLRPLRAQTTKMRFAVGPLLPTPSDTIKAYTPVFEHLATQLGVEYSLVSTTDWAGMAVAMGSGQLDLAWMGPWGRGAGTEWRRQNDALPLYRRTCQPNRWPDQRAGIGNIEA